MSEIQKYQYYMSDSTTKYTYQLNTYYGIFYTMDQCDTVLNILKDSNLYAELGGEEAETIIDGITLCASTNSDKSDEAEWGFIFVDDMSQMGPDCERYEEISLDINVTELYQCEIRNVEAVRTVSKLHSYLLKKLKQESIDYSDIYIGWRTLACVWDLSCSEESSDSPLPAKRTKAKKDRPTAKPIANAPKRATRKPAAPRSTMASEIVELPQVTRSGSGAKSQIIVGDIVVRKPTDPPVVPVTTVVRKRGQPKQ